MIKLIAKSNKAKNKLDHHGEFAEVQDLNDPNKIGFQIGEFKGKPAILVKHVDTDALRWVLLDDVDTDFGVDLDPWSHEDDDWS